MSKNTEYVAAVNSIQDREVLRDNWSERDDKAEELIAAAERAEQELQQGHLDLKQLRWKMERTGPSLQTNAFVTLAAQITQCEMGLEQKMKRLQSIRQERDEYLDRQRQELDRMTARNTYDGVLKEFEVTRTTLLKQQEEMKHLVVAIEYGSAKHSELLYKMNEAKNRCKTLGIEV